MSRVMTIRSRRPRQVAAVIALVVGAMLVAVSMLPVTTRQGVDYVVTTQRLPLYLKALDFVDRDLNYRALARRITAGQATDEGRMVAVFRWTRANIRDVPAGFPVVDDHIWHIIVRGYGVDEQKVDVFATLATYAGVPAYWIKIGGERERLPVALVRLDGRWRLVDVANGLLFRNGRGEPAAADEVAANPSLIAAAAGERRYGGRPYADYFRDFRAPAAPATLRAEKQMPWSRMIFELKRRFGLEGSAADGPGVEEARRRTTGPGAGASADRLAARAASARVKTGTTADRGAVYQPC